MITRKIAGATIVVTNLDAGSTKPGLDIPVNVKAKFTFPDYPEGADPALLPVVYIDYLGGNALPVQGQEVEFVLPAGFTKITFQRDYDRVDGRDYGPNTKRTFVTVDIEKNEDTVGFDGPQTYELLYERDDEFSVVLPGQVTKTPYSPQVLEFYKLNQATDKAAAYFADTIGVPATDERGNISKLFRMETVFSPIEKAETIWFTPNLGNSEDNQHGNYRSRHGRDIPIWVKDEYTALFYQHAIINPGAGIPRFDENSTNLKDFNDLFFVEHRVNGQWYVTPKDDGSQWTGFPSDISLYNEVYKSLGDTATRQEIFENLNACRLPAGASGIRITFYPPFYAFWKDCFEGKEIGYSGDMPFPPMKSGFSTCFLMHSPRPTFGARDNRAFPKRTSIWFVLDANTFMNTPDASLAIPSILLEDGRALMTENSMVVTPESNVIF